MVRFYDPTSTVDQSRMEELLRSKGIEYFLNTGKPDGGPVEILVAEEDLAFAEELLRSHTQTDTCR